MTLVVASMMAWSVFCVGDGVASDANAVSYGSTSEAYTYGPQGPEGDRLREQIWTVPGGGKTPLRATVFRPRSSPPGGSPLVVINHGTDGRSQETASRPVFIWLTRWFVARGYVVLLPQRRGYGETGGVLVEGTDSCLRPRHQDMGEAAADDIEGAIAYLVRQPFVDPRDITVIGISSGGWASLALAARNPVGVRSVINFAGGRGAYAWGQRGALCAGDQLVAAAADFGRRARVPTLWLYAENDSYFSPPVVRAMQAAWTTAGGRAELHIVPPVGREGHLIAELPTAREVWSGILDAWLASTPAAGGIDASDEDERHAMAVDGARPIAIGRGD
ncbi:MAG: CocE/NonD family hydrolase [Hyphomicrobiaceae bacterium]